MKLYNWKEKINNVELEDVIKVLRNNGIIIFPTETVYGIGGNALSNNVVDKIYKIKERPREKALNIMLSDKDKIESYAQIVSDLEKKIIDKFMPGPITIILKRKKNFGDYFTSNNDTIGIRIPEHEIIKEILEKVDFPLIAPSANVTGKESGTKILNIVKDFKDKVEIIIDGGNIKSGLPSTIVQVVDNEIKVLRQGIITKEEIYRRIN